MKIIQLIISGRVQGVHFRAYTQKQAVKLGVTGFASNKEDGSVEVIACAEQENLDTFINWCHKGSMFAKVENIIVNEYESFETYTQFEIR